MRRFPWLLILGLTLMWLLLADVPTFGQFVLGLAVATLMTLGFRAVRPGLPRIRRPLSAMRLLWRVSLDILRSNYAMARIMLGFARGAPSHSGFVDIPLDVQDPHALATLAAIVTSTPGTVWAELSPDNRVLTLHVLDLRDPVATREFIKTRYEGLLREIFE